MKRPRWWWYFSQSFLWGSLLYSPVTHSDVANRKSHGTHQIVLSSSRLGSICHSPCSHTHLLLYILHCAQRLNTRFSHEQPVSNLTYVLTFRDTITIRRRNWKQSSSQFLFDLARKYAVQASSGSCRTMGINYCKIRIFLCLPDVPNVTCIGSSASNT